MNDERPRGRADLHIHSLASDGVSSVLEILDHAEGRAGLHVIAITDHERIDAAIAARTLAQEQGLRVQVIVGEEITTRGGHLVGLFVSKRISPWQSLRASVAKIHEQGGIAIASHPLVPYPLCATESSIRRLMDDPDAIFHLDAIEAFNPTTAGMRWQKRIPPFIEEMGVSAVAASDAHRAEDIGQAITTFAGTTPEEMRAAILARTTEWEGAPYPWRRQMETFGLQMQKNVLAVHDDVRGKLTRTSTGRDLGYPGGRLRPPRIPGQPDPGNGGDPADPPDEAS